MRKLLLGVSCAVLATASASAQSPITITSADMPVNGDKLLYSTSLPTASLDLSVTGANVAWDFSSLTPVAQAIDTYKTAIQAGYFGGGISTTAYGYKVADTLGFAGAPISAQKVYTFFSIKSSPSRFVAEGFGATISGFPVPAGYSQEDTIYRFPLTYGSSDTTVFKLTASLATIGTWKQQGTRTWTVDGWGTIKTPYFTTPAAAIRMRSEVNEIDSVTFAGTTFPVPRNFVEYKWLVNGEHYPALFVTTTLLAGNETPTAVRYRDVARNLNVAATTPRYTVLSGFPNPVKDQLMIRVPADWKNFQVSVYDAAGRVVAQGANTATVETTSLPSGSYIAVVIAGEKAGLVQFVK